MNVRVCVCVCICVCMQASENVEGITEPQESSLSQIVNYKKWMHDREGSGAVQHLRRTQAQTDSYKTLLLLLSCFSSVRLCAKRGVCKLQLALVNTLVIYKVGSFGFVFQLKMKEKIESFFMKNQEVLKTKSFVYSRVIHNMYAYGFMHTYIF